MVGAPYFGREVPFIVGGPIFGGGSNFFMGDFCVCPIFWHGGPFFCGESFFGGGPIFWVYGPPFFWYGAIFLGMVPHFWVWGPFFVSPNHHHHHLDKLSSWDGWGEMWRMSFGIPPGGREGG